jgi:hypothetical protein
MQGFYFLKEAPPYHQYGFPRWLLVFCGWWLIINWKTNVPQRWATVLLLTITLLSGLTTGKVTMNYY